MATDDTSETVEGSWSPKRPRTAAEQRATRHEGTTDPEVLADDIEKTREELAETLDAIADKVSPKKVAKRTTRKATAAAKDGVQDAADAVKETAHTATEALKDTVASVKDKVAGTGSDVPRGPVEPVTSALASPLPTGTVSVDAGEPAPAATTGSLADAAAVTGEPAGADLPPYRPVAAPSAPAPSTLPMIAGAAAALAVVLLVLRRRRRRR